MRVELTELQGRGAGRKGIKIHLKEVDAELPVDVVELIPAFAVFFVQMLFINLIKVLQVVRTFEVDAFMYKKVLTIFYLYQGMAAMRTFQDRCF